MVIYEPREDSELLRKHVKKLAHGVVLDVGTGTGVQALEAVRKRNVQKVVAVDIDKEAIDYCKKNIKNKKITFLVSDLFPKGKARFDTIIFNPPYLPAMPGEAGHVARALAGGKHGYELLERFLNQVNKYLKDNGIILIIFSSLTNKQKVDEFIENNLFEFKELERLKLFFEELYCYAIKKNDVLKILGRKGVTNIKYFSKGKRGKVFTARYKSKKIAIKIKRKESEAIGRMQNEAKWLKKLNQLHIGPKLLFSGADYLAYTFVEGDFILDFIAKNNKTKIKKVLDLIFKQCFKLDKLGANKEEMHRPLKHVIIKNNKATLIDFERTHKSKKPKNVTQFTQFVCAIKKELAKKGFKINVNKLRALSKVYKENMTKKNLDIILKNVN